MRTTHLLLPSSVLHLTQPRAQSVTLRSSIGHLSPCFTNMYRNMKILCWFSSKPLCWVY